MTQPNVTGPLQLAVPIAYAYCPDGRLESLPDDIRQGVSIQLQDAAERRAADAGVRLVGEHRFVGQVQAPKGYEAAEGLTWLRWEWDVEDVEAET